MSLTILCDVDGVVADFMSANLAAIKAVTGRDYTADQVTGWDVAAALGLTETEWHRVVAHIIAPGYCLRQFPYPGAVSAVSKLAHDHDFYFVTTPWRGARTWVDDRETWIAEWFGADLSRRMIHTEHKQLVRGTILIDDKVSNCTKWADANSWPSCACCWTRTWNASIEIPESQGVVRVNTWPDVERVIREMEGA